MNKISSDKNLNPEDQNSENKPQPSESRLILYNDDVNDISYVMECICNIFEYDVLQAEQITLLAHYNGSSTIKVGSVPMLTHLSGLLKEKGLKSAIIQNDQQ
jgi:ATP-dependent Clp protease adapter protein ClpS